MNQKKLKELLKYNPATGIFVWKKRTSNRIQVGDIAAPNQKGRYKQIGINNKLYCLHHLAWLYMYGNLPLTPIDHIDQNTHNNAIYNLRSVSHQENAKNRPKRRDNKSGITGVSWDKFNNKWVVRIKDNHGKYKNIGRYYEIEEAKKAHNKATREMGYHSNHGKYHTKSTYRKV